MVYVLNYLVEYWSCEMLDSKNNKKKVWENRKTLVWRIVEKNEK